MKVPWHTGNPTADGWYLIKRAASHVEVAFWFNYATHWSQCGQRLKCIVKDVIGWMEIEE